MSELWLANFLKAFPAACPLCRRPLSPECARCGKCGSELRVGLKAVEPYLIAWGLTLGATAVIAGFGIFLLLLMLIRTPFAPLWVRMIFFGIGALGLFMAAASFALLLLRRHFVRLPRLVQWGAAVACWGIVLITAVVFASVLR